MSRIRIAKRTSIGGALGDHISGKLRPASAVSRDGMPAVYDYGKEEGAAGWLPAADAALAACRKTARRQRGVRARPCVEFVMNGPPAFHDPDSWTLDQIADWGRRSLLYVGKRLEGTKSQVARAALHLDESAPHLHLLIVAADEHGRPGWNRIEGRFGRTGKEKGRAALRALHTTYAGEIGLPRAPGERGRRYGPKVDRGVAVANRVRELERENERLRNENRELARRPCRDPGR